MELSSQEKQRSLIKWSTESSRKIVYRVIATGTLVLETPAHFGTGEQDGTQMMILKDAIDGSPLLPGASVAGALRHYLLKREVGYRRRDHSAQVAHDNEKTISTLLFGEALFQEERGTQSRIIVHDALGTADSLGIRDGVKIKADTRTADDDIGALFSVQVWPEGTTFDLILEMLLYEEDRNILLDETKGITLEDCLLAAFGALLQALKDGEIPLGARKHRGYGKATVSNWHLSEYDFSNQSQFLSWVLNQELENKADKLLNINTFQDERERVALDMQLLLTDSIMIRAGAELVDATHLTDSKGKPIISGTSIAGALRARALKIAKTIYPQDEDAEDLVDDMFGKHGSSDAKESSSRDLTASRIRVSEVTELDAQNDLIQNRVKIDRFTGGAFETALISEQPAFAKDATLFNLKIELQIPADEEWQSYVKRQTGLLLLLIKDLWTQDLPIGGESSIGRGRLQGHRATLRIGKASDPGLYEFDETGLTNPEQVTDLQEYMEILWS